MFILGPYNFYCEDEDKKGDFVMCRRLGEPVSACSLRKMTPKFVVNQNTKSNNLTKHRRIRSQFEQRNYCS